LEGVDVWDVTHLEGSKRFTLHTILILSIHDLLTYGLLYGQMTKGYKGCLACGPNTCSCHSKMLRKTIYCHHHMWLRPNHPFRFNAHDFDDKIERRFAPTVMSRYESVATC
jgi:hypothetical protein